jgi:hypothetical protein
VLCFLVLIAFEAVVAVLVGMVVAAFAEVRIVRFATLVILWRR